MQNGKAGDADFGGQFPAGRDLLSGLQVAAENRLSISVLNLLMQGRSGTSIHRDDGRDQGSHQAHDAVLDAM